MQVQPGAGAVDYLLGATKMRQISIVTAAVWVTVIVALFGATAMIAKVPHGTVSASGSIDTRQLTKDAKPLPIEQFDAI